MQPDEEHQAFALAIEDRSGGYPRHHRVDHRLRDDRRVPHARGELPGRASGIQGPMIVKTTAGVDSAADDAAADDAAQAAADETAIGGAPLDDATKLAAEPKTPDRGAPKRREGRDARSRSSRSTSSSSSSSPPARRASPSTATRASAR